VKKRTVHTASRANAERNIIGEMGGPFNTRITEYKLSTKQEK
jgi:hypothetical protein